MYLRFSSNTFLVWYNFVMLLRRLYHTKKRIKNVVYSYCSGDMCWGKQEFIAFCFVWYVHRKCFWVLWKQMGQRSNHTKPTQPTPSNAVFSRPVDVNLPCKQRKRRHTLVSQSPGNGVSICPPSHCYVQQATGKVLTRQARDKLPCTHRPLCNQT